tara:strand:- start:6495 stop:8078 length:1584 start_codon:yes stop_codon:yes gene_type:complete
MAKREKEILLNQFLDLAEALTDQENEIARKHIIAYDSNTTGESQKMFRLFREIVSKKTKNYDSLKEKISKDSSDVSFNRLIRRTLYRVQESLIVEVNIDRKGMYSEIFRKRFEIRKRIMQAYILHGKGLPEMANRVFDTIIKSTKSFELYDELIEALLLKQSIILSIKGRKSFDLINQQIDFYHLCRDLLQKTKNVYRIYSVDVYTKGIKADKLKFLEENMKIVQAYFQQTKSANILSQYYLLEMEYYYLVDNIEAEEITGLRLLDLMQNNKAVFSKPRISYVYNSLSNTMYSSLNFDKCYTYIAESLKWSESKLNINYVIACEQQINSLFYLNDYDKASGILNQVIDLPLLKKYPYHNSKVYYQQAMNHFAMMQYNDSKKLLSMLNEIEKDKEGWNIWVRIMRILCSVEIEKYNLLDYDLENLRKYFDRVEKINQVRKRDRMILSFLTDLNRNHFNYKEVAIKKADTLQKLKSTHKDYKWDPKSPEMILFHDWFEAKLNNKPYEPNFAPYRKEFDEKKLKVQKAIA